MSDPRFEEFVRSLASVRASGGLGEIARSARELCTEVDAELAPWYPHLRDNPPPAGATRLPSPATESGRRSTGPEIIRCVAPTFRDFEAMARRLQGSSWHVVVDGDGRLKSVTAVSPHERQVDGLVERHAEIEESVSDALGELCDSLNELSVARSAYRCADGGDFGDELEGAAKALAVDCCALVAALRRSRR